MPNKQERDIGRANLYRLLADCYQVPDNLESENIRQIPTFVEMFYPEGIDAANGMMEAWPLGEKDWQDIRVAHAKLFIGPFDLLAPPYGSVYLDEDRRVMGDSTMDVIRYYQKAGLDPNQEFHEPPDHISSELEFMYYLAFQYMAQGDAPYLELQREFLAKHLLQWIPLFSARVLTGDLHPFYNQLAILTSIIVHTDDTKLEASSNLWRASVSSI